MGDGRPRLLKYERWQSPTGKWSCNDVSDLMSKRGRWYVPARMLEKSLDSFIQMLIDDFEVDNIRMLGNDAIIYSWNDEKKCAKFMNYINAEARKRKYIL